MTIGIEQVDELEIGYEFGAVAQSVEQRTENPCVGGSIPPHTTKASPWRLFFMHFIYILFSSSFDRFYVVHGESLFRLDGPVMLDNPVLMATVQDQSEMIFLPD